MLVHNSWMEEGMSRTTDTYGSIGRCGNLVGMAALASLLVLSPGYAKNDDNNQGDNNNQGNNNNSGGGQTRGEAGADRGLRLAPIQPSPDNTTAGAMYSFDISYVDQTVRNQT